METSLHQRESTATVENVTVRLIINDLILPDDPLVNRTDHFHVYTELFVCTAGEISVSIDNSVTHLPAGNALFVPAHLLHRKLPSQGDCQWCSVGFTITQRSARSLHNLFKRLKSCFGGTRPLLMRDCMAFCRSITELTNNKSAAEYLPALQLTVALSEAADSVMAKFTGEGSHLPSVTDIYREAQLDNIIGAHFMDELSCEQVAKQLCISTRHLSRIVKQRYGVSLREAVNAKRLAVAAKLLEDTELSLEEIGTAVGFRSKSSFYRAFGDHYGMPPLAYRMAHSGTDPD